jgi:hypothetical protein
VRTPLLLVLGAFALLGVLMLGGWALTSGTPDVPAREAPAAGSAAGSGAAGARGEQRSRQTGGGAQPADREQQDAGGAEARARDLARQVRQRLPLSGVAGSATARRSTTERPALPLRRGDDGEAAQRRRAAEAARLAELRRAEQLRWAERAREEAAERAEEAERGAGKAPDAGGGDEVGGD